MTRTHIAALAFLTAAIGGAAASAATTTASGGLAISPAIIEHTAAPGAVGQLRVANGSNRSIAVRIRARPWVQARSGAVDADSRRTLPQIRLGATAFTLAPGEARTVAATLLSRPGSDSLYGAIEVLGTPKGGSTANGVKVRYRLLGGLRLSPTPARRKLRVRVGPASADGTNAVLAVRNLGNTVEPISGASRIVSASGTLRDTIAAQRILPGSLVDLRLHRGRLPRGTYTATVTLRQAGHKIASATKRFRVTR
ncbi:MAG TPA: hypothetical protein VFG42_19820 [Baekduia sp.]|uniref:hypothetical protein n=1 Tax=Baekduia sp. TaxID=2600305 RepID=UPI002D799A69|nr:hypothetical protein [Baekduia sp.]HET6509052.1 hypothetical protein [Baekduia sp.]